MKIVSFLVCLITLILNIYRSEKLICKPPNIFAQIFAPPGTGKTTLAAKIVRGGLKQKTRVYSNVTIAGAIKFDIKDLGKKEFKDCALIIDEAGTEVSNRNWHTNLNDSQVEFLKKHRHYNVDIYLFSQAYGDVDNKFRELTTSLYMLKKSRLPFFIKACAIKKNMDLINGQIVEFFEWDKMNSFRFFVVNLWAYFNSYEIKKNLPKNKLIRYFKTDVK